MDVVNRLGGESKMDAEELNHVFNDSAVSTSFSATFTHCQV